LTIKFLLQTYKPVIAGATKNRTADMTAAEKMYQLLSLLESPLAESPKIKIKFTFGKGVD